MSVVRFERLNKQATYISLITLCRNVRILVSVSINEVGVDVVGRRIVTDTVKYDTRLVQTQNVGVPILTRVKPWSDAYTNQPETENSVENVTDEPAH